MAAEKKGQTIVIKKIYNVAGGHGGSWKVALADFMTALMCFFLVMWLLNQSAETKKAVSDYFSSCVSYFFVIMKESVDNFDDLFFSFSTS